MCGLEGRGAGENAVIGHDADVVAVNIGETGTDGGPVLLLELPETAPVDYSRNHIPHIKRLTDIRANNAMQFMCRVQWFFGCCGWLRVFSV